MKQLVVRVMLICIASFAPVYADPLGAGLGADRSTLSAEQIAVRSRRFEESTTFSLLRYPEALRAPARILSPGIWGFIDAAARAHKPRSDGARRDDLRRELRRPAGEKPDRTRRHRAVDQSVGKGARAVDRSQGADRHEGRQEDAVGGERYESPQGRSDGATARLQNDRRAIRS